MAARKQTLEKRIGVAELKAKCTGVIKKVQKDQSHYVVTVRGVPAAEIRPLDSASQKSVRFGTWAKSVALHGDLVSESMEGDYEDADPQGLLSIGR